MGEIMEVRKAYRMEQWRQVIQDCQKSGLSNKAYCEQQGISEKTYYYWLRKLRTAAAEQAGAQIVELGPAEKTTMEELYEVYPLSRTTLIFRGVRRHPVWYTD